MHKAQAPQHSTAQHAAPHLPGYMTRQVHLLSSEPEPVDLLSLLALCKIRAVVQAHHKVALHDRPVVPDGCPASQQLPALLAAGLEIHCGVKALHHA